MSGRVAFTVVGERGNKAIERKGKNLVMSSTKDQ